MSIVKKRSVIVHFLIIWQYLIELDFFFMDIYDSTNKQIVVRKLSLAINSAIFLFYFHESLVNSRVVYNSKSNM